LAEELGRYLNDEPIRARPVGVVGRAWRWGHRKPAQATLVGLLATAVALGLAGVLWQWGRAQATAVRESLERERAERTVYRLQIQTAQGFFANQNAAAGLSVLAALLRQDPTDQAVAEWLMAELTGRNWPLPVIEPLVHKEAVHYAEFSPDGTAHRDRLPGFHGARLESGHGPSSHGPVATPRRGVFGALQPGRQAWAHGLAGQHGPPLECVQRQAGSGDSAA
jgi:hypothetical protein